MTRLFWRCTPVLRISNVHMEKMGFEVCVGVCLGVCAAPLPYAHTLALQIRGAERPSVVGSDRFPAAPAGKLAFPAITAI